MKKSTDFQRDVVALFGIPFDVLNQVQAEQRVMQAMRRGRKFFMSTPNLNFVATCQHDEGFRDSVLMSDLSLVDGSGVMLLAKLMRTPLPERVAGSTLFDNLVRHAPKALKVFLFGGAQGVAATAARRLNERTHHHTVVGWQEPGFGEEALNTTPAQLTDIRQSRPNFLLVALGAQKGQRWILDHFDALPACVISHLGATINFIAGTVVRAPARFQRLGLEWLWRIKEEPRLWQRYASDALEILVTFTRQWLHQFVLEPVLLHGPLLPPSATLQLERDGMHLSLRGCWRHEDGMRLARLLATAAASERDIELHFGEDTRLDAYIVGKLLLLTGHQVAAQRELRVRAARPALLRQLRRQGLHDVPDGRLTAAASPAWPASAGAWPQANPSRLA